MARKARLDADKTAKPLTEIRAVHKAGECVKPGIGASAYVVAGQAVSSREYKEGYRAGSRLRKEMRSYAHAVQCFDNWCNRNGRFNVMRDVALSDFVRGYDDAN
jgi:hypothetical protein